MHNMTFSTCTHMHMLCMHMHMCDSCVTVATDISRDAFTHEKGRRSLARKQSVVGPSTNPELAPGEIAGDFFP